MLNQSLSNPDMISYLKWSAREGDGAIIGYKTYQLRCLVNDPKLALDTGQEGSRSRKQIGQ